MHSLLTGKFTSVSLALERGTVINRKCFPQSNPLLFSSGRFLGGTTPGSANLQCRRQKFSRKSVGLCLVLSAVAAENVANDIKGVVITGGTKGLGFAMAHEFLAAGDKVLICGRSAERTHAATRALANTIPDARVHGVKCDVTNPSDVEALGELARERLGTVHLWVNNAGGVTAKRLLADLPADEVAQIAATNVVGSLLGSREAIRVMRAQSRAAQRGASPIAPYHVFNMGFSRWGAAFSQTACTHKSTKTALTALSLALAKELKQEGITTIGVHNLSPGMALTDLLLKDSTPGARRFFNALAEEPETVAAWLMPRMRALTSLSSSIDFLSPPAAILKVILGLPQIINGGRFFDKQGNRVASSGNTYRANGVRLLYPEQEKEENKQEKARSKVAA